MKNSTSIEQSKILKDILPLDSHDMYYEAKNGDLNSEFNLFVGQDIAILKNLFSYRFGYTIPAWSLAALLDVLKSGDYRFSLEYFKDEGWGARATFNSVTRPDLLSVSNEPIDTCCKLILELNKGELL